MWETFFVFFFFGGGGGEGGAWIGLLVYVRNEAWPCPEALILY